MPETTRTISVDYLARVEGEGALHVKIENDVVTDVRLEIFEPPRYFEGILRGRAFTEAPDITARICGICPVAYQIGASHAMEHACGVTVEGVLRDLRHLLYCGEWIESHALHVYLLHLPDFLGFEDAIQMARDHGELVKKGLKVKKLGNEIMRLLGGREIHPINPRVGGFYKAPSRADLEALRAPLEEAIENLLVTMRVAAALHFPDFDQDYEFVALSHPEEYAILGGRIISNRGLDIPISKFLEEFYEEHVERSTSLHGLRRGGEPYMVGPLARYNLNYDRLSPRARDAAEEFGPGPACFNPYKSLLVRLVELIHACDTALSLIDRYSFPARPFVEVPPRAGTGFGCTEAPRGICWHTYTIDGAGLIENARIVPPTSQNQRMMEADLRRFVNENLDLADDDLQWKCEQGIRNYDPCISCSCHFLKLKIERS